MISLQASPAMEINTTSSTLLFFYFQNRFKDYFEETSEMFSKSSSVNLSSTIVQSA